MNKLPKHTSSPERMMLTTITGLITLAQECKKSFTVGVPMCPLMGTLLATKKSLEVKVNHKGKNEDNS